MVGWRRTRRESVIPECGGRTIFSGAAGAVIRSNCSRRPGSTVCVAIALQPIYRREAAVACHARAIFDALPLELTNASDFPILLDRPRRSIPQGRAPTVFVALLDERIVAVWVSVAGLPCGPSAL